MLSKSTTRVLQIGTIVGFFLVSPVGVIGSLGGGLVLGPFVGPLVFGTIPLVLVTAAGFGVGMGIQKVFFIANSKQIVTLSLSKGESICPVMVRQSLH